MDEVVNEREGIGLFNALIHEVNRQRREKEELLLHECKERWRNSENIPLDLLREMAWSGKGGEWIKLHHPFYPTYDATLQIDLAFNMLAQARSSLIELYGHYHSALIYEGFKISEEVSWKTTQEVFKYIFASSSLVQAYRRFKDSPGVDQDGYHTAFECAFKDRDLLSFVQRLRNCYGHQFIIKVYPDGKISYGESVQVESALTFDKNLLLTLNGAWNADARRFIEKSDTLNVLSVVDGYHAMALALFRSYRSASGVSHRAEFNEIMRCEHAVKLYGELNSIKLMLQVAERNGIDPYAYISDYFTNDELSRIYCLPSHSRAQVDFMVKLRDPLGMCDPNIINNLYKVFNC